MVDDVSSPTTGGLFDEIGFPHSYRLVYDEKGSEVWDSSYLHVRWIPYRVVAPG